MNVRKGFHILLTDKRELGASMFAIRRKGDLNWIKARSLRRATLFHSVRVAQFWIDTHQNVLIDYLPTIVPGERDATDQK